MKAAYGVEQSKGWKIGICAILIVYVVILIYGLTQKEWATVVIPFLLNLILFYFMLRREATRHIQITENDRLMLGTHQMEIKTINQIEFYDSCSFRAYYTLGGEARTSPKIRLKGADKEDFLATLTTINPNIQIKSI